MYSRWTNVIIFVLSAFVLLVAVGQIFFAGGEEYQTETAYFYGMEEEIPFVGVYLRDETLIYGSGSGVLSYEHEDGSKVGKSSVIARRYRSENEIEYRREIESLYEQIEVLRSAEELIGTDSSQLEAISSQINEQHSAMVNCIIAGDYSGAEAVENSLLEAMCKREITLKECDGYSEKIAQIEARIDQLESKLSGEVSEIYADGTGYFVSKVDGYEGELSFDSVESLTAEQVQSVIAKPDKASGKAIGKLIADYTWRLATVIDSKQMFGINEGSEVSLRVGSQTSLLDAEVIYVKKLENGKALYVFECDSLTSAVVESRTAQFKLVINSYGGLRFPRDAIRYDEKDQMGVFVVNGSTMDFRKIDVIYWGEQYVISSQVPEDGYLKLYDKIITEGKELYDGKVIE